MQFIIVREKRKRTPGKNCPAGRAPQGTGGSADERFIDVCAKWSWGPTGGRDQEFVGSSSLPVRDFSPKGSATRVSQQKMLVVDWIRDWIWAEQVKEPKEQKVLNERAHVHDSRR